MYRRFKFFLETWKPIPLCWWFEKRGLPIPKYFIGGGAVAPSVTTNDATSIQATQATGNGDVTSDGGASISERGFVHSVTSVNSNPVIGGAGVTKTIVSGTTGAYSGTLASLTASTGYSYKAYATNSKGTSYGVVKTFTTSAPTTPTVTTQAVSSIAQTTATGNGNVTSDGGATVTERGVVANTTGTPTTSDLKFQAVAGGTGVFTASMTSLGGETHYYVRAYAINSVGTSYGGEVEFDTLEQSPTVVLNTPADTATGISTTPTLEFTGTDPGGDDVRYNVQIFDGNPDL